MVERREGPTGARKKIAVVGGGIAGVAAAWQLHEAHEVTLFEAQPRLGGHVHTAEIPGDGTQTSATADLGVIIINTRGYPNLAALYQKLRIGLRPITLSVQAYFGPDGDHWGTHCHDTRLFREVEADCHTFQDSLMHRFDVPMTDFSVTLGAYCDRLGLSQVFREKALVPLLIVLQVTRGSLWETPVVFVRQMFRHGVLSFFAPPSGWVMIEGGSAREIDALSSTLGDRVRPRTRVQRVQRSQDSVTVHWEGGPPGGEQFDDVILTCSLDIARRLIAEDADEVERAALDPKSFQYEDLQVFLHTDLDAVAQGTPEPWLFQYNHTARGRSVTLNPTQRSLGTGAAPAPLVTYCFDADATPAPDKVQERVTFSHLIATPAACAAAIGLRAINGRRHTFYAGHSCALPPNWHEGAFVSGLVVAQALGAPYPFRGDAAAERVFALLSMVMGVDAPAP